LVNAWLRKKMHRRPDRWLRMNVWVEDASWLRVDYGVIS
jgi:hypothetical protein